MVRAARFEELIGPAGHAEAQKCHVVLLWCRIGEGLAGADVVERWCRGVDEVELLLTGVVDGVLDALGVEQYVDARVAVGVETFELAFEEQCVADVVVGGDDELDGVEQDLTGPVVVVADEPGDRVLAAGLEDEGSGADGFLVECRVLQRVGEPRRRRHETQLAGEHTREVAPGSDQVDGEGEVVDLLGAAVGIGECPNGDTHEGIGQLRLEVENGCVGVQRRAVVEGDALAQGDRPGGEVLVGFDRLGEVGDGVAVDVVGGEGVEHRVAHGEARCRQRRGGGVDAIDVGIDTEAQGATSDGGLVGGLVLDLLDADALVLGGIAFGVVAAAVAIAGRLVAGLAGRCAISTVVVVASAGGGHQCECEEHGEQSYPARLGVGHESPPERPKSCRPGRMDSVV